MRPKPSDDPVMKTRAIIVSLSENLINETFANFESLFRALREGAQPEVYPSCMAAGCFSQKSIAPGPFTTSSVTMRQPWPSLNKRNVSTVFAVSVSFTEFAAPFGTPLLFFSTISRWHFACISSGVSVARSGSEVARKHRKRRSVERRHTVKRGLCGLSKSP